MSIDYHQYGEYRIPVMTGKNANPFYNLPQDEIDKLSKGTFFDDDGFCMEPGGFRGAPFESEFSYLDDQEIKERCEFQKREKTSILHLMVAHEVPVKNQNGLGYCWGYGACSAVEANLLVQNEKYIELSPESVCAPVKNGRNRGGWASEFLEYADEHGIAKQTTWARHDTNYRKYDTPEINAERMEFKPEKFVDIEPRDMHAVRSLAADNRACGLGLMWWGHLLMFGITDWSDKYGWLYGERNSHGHNYGLDGWCFHTNDSAMHGGGSTVLVAA